ncbi:hypothetical protein [Leyella stercorea]|uniref:hypothetical protein n=1 Tax=Leyella stercorea TaxID=363265 RepID=UPI0024316A0D|nr:hypothetical protein [Leyella stercorea]
MASLPYPRNLPTIKQQQCNKKAAWNGRRVWHPCHTHAIYQLSSSSNATRRLRGYGKDAIPS